MIRLTVHTGPSYDMRHWRLARGDAGALVMRPSGTAITGRLIWLTAVILVILVLRMMLESGELPWMSPSFQNSFQVFLAMVGVAPVLKTLFNHARIERTPSNHVIVKTPLAFKAREWPLASFSAIAINASEYMEGSGWHWTVEFVPNLVANLPRPGLVQFQPIPQGPIFLLHWSRSHPGTVSIATPAPVANFVRALARLTGLPVEKPMLREAMTTPGVRTVTRSVSIPLGSPDLRQTTQTFTSLDQLPEEWRDTAQQLMAQAETQGGFAHTQQITIRDSDGNVRQFTSIDSVPAEVLSLLQQMPPPPDHLADH